MRPKHADFQGPVLDGSAPSRPTGETTDPFDATFDPLAESRRLWHSTQGRYRAHARRAGVRPAALTGSWVDRATSAANDSGEPFRPSADWNAGGD